MKHILQSLKLKSCLFAFGLLAVSNSGRALTVPNEILQVVDEDDRILTYKTADLNYDGLKDVW